MLEQKVTTKADLEVEEDFFTLTCYSYLTVNSDTKTWGVFAER